MHHILKLSHDDVDNDKKMLIFKPFEEQEFYFRYKIPKLDSGFIYTFPFKIYNEFTQEDFSIEVKQGNDEIEELCDIVEMDETYVGGKPRKARRNLPPVGIIPEYEDKIKELGDKGFEFKEGKYKKPYDKEKPKRGRQADIEAEE